MWIFVNLVTGVIYEVHVYSQFNPAFMSWDEENKKFTLHFVARKLYIYMNLDVGVYWLSAWVNRGTDAYYRYLCIEGIFCIKINVTTGLNFVTLAE